MSVSLPSISAHRPLPKRSGVAIPPSIELNKEVSLIEIEKRGESRTNSFLLSSGWSNCNIEPAGEYAWNRFYGKNSLQRSPLAFFILACHYHLRRRKTAPALVSTNDEGGKKISTFRDLPLDTVGLIALFLVDPVPFYSSGDVSLFAINGGLRQSYDTVTAGDASSNKGWPWMKITKSGAATQRLQFIEVLALQGELLTYEQVKYTHTGESVEQIKKPSGKKGGMVPRVATLATSEGSKRREAEKWMKANSGKRTLVGNRPLHTTLPPTPSEINWIRDLGIAFFISDNPMENWSWRVLPATEIISQSQQHRQPTTAVVDARSSAARQKGTVGGGPGSQRNPRPPPPGGGGSSGIMYSPATVFLEGPEQCIVDINPSEPEPKPFRMCLKSYLKENFAFTGFPPSSFGVLVRRLLASESISSTRKRKQRPADNSVHFISFQPSRGGFTEPCMHPLDQCVWEAMKHSFVFGSAEFSCRRCGARPLMLHSVSGYDDVENVVQAIDSAWCRRNEFELKKLQLLPDKLVYDKNS